MNDSNPLHEKVSLRLKMQNFKNLFPLLCLSFFLLLANNESANCEDNGTFSGQVMDVYQNPVAGVEIFVYNSSNIRRPANYISAPTNKSGEFRITLPPGHYWTVARLRMGKERFGPLQPGDKHSGALLEIDILSQENVSEEFIVADLEETSRLAVKFDTSFIQVEGLLLTKNGQPVANAYAFANLNPTMKRIPDYISASTDSSGRYILFLPPGTYYLGLALEFPPDSKTQYTQKFSVDSNTKNVDTIIWK